MAVAGGGRPGRLLARGGSSSSKQKQRTINNIRVTLLAAFITFLVLRCAIGVNRLTIAGAGSDRRAARSQVIEDIERVLREIRSDSDPDEDDAASSTASPATASRSYSLGPRVTRWNAKRRQWQHRNPGFPPRDARGNPRVLLVTGSPPGPCDDPVGDHYLLRATKNKIDYCRLHGIELAHSMARLDPELAGGGGWSKLQLLRRLMLAHPEVEWLWWVDSDAVITDMGFELPFDRYVTSNLVVHGHHDLVFKRRSWVALSTGSFLLRNCQWSLELLDAWARMGPKGRVRAEAGKLLTASLKGRPAFEADDQSALIHLLITEKQNWMDKVYLENEYYLHGLWVWVVDRFEQVMEKHHPGYGDDRWPFVTHFVGCDPCGGRSSSSGTRHGDYSPERCLRGMERAFNFADNQVLMLYGFRHPSLASAEVRRVENRSANPLEAKEAAIEFLTKPKEVQIHDVRKHRKRVGKRESVLGRILRKLGLGGRS
ncbi:hypothetical protein ACP70R_020447 [Stipagrostis hirtigluma subsp. patula]